MYGGPVIKPFPWGVALPQALMIPSET
jgi:hypothetical protein